MAALSGRSVAALELRAAGHASEDSRQRQRKRQKPERPRARPTSLFFARRAMRFGLPEATA